MITNLPPPTDGVRLKLDGVVAYVEKNSVGAGTLFIAENVIAWAGNNGTNISIPYQALSMFAISRDLTDFNRECILLMLMTSLDEAGNAAGEGYVMLRLVPEDKESCKLQRSLKSEL
ncbi:Voldacs domain containing protein [Trichuris trichiura]|uniref:Voldacs domain containing protein n=1 Tax=Trichuris trichiura TaxID=36087 RepID=A0A077ZB99_TRITR|nr:Voldacs domain containing protein [Trichuris trichiura]